MLLAGDIGGTKTALALFAPETGPRVPHAQAEFPSADFPNLEALLRAFLERVTLPVERACFDLTWDGTAYRARASEGGTPTLPRPTRRRWDCSTICWNAATTSATSTSAPALGSPTSTRT